MKLTRKKTKELAREKLFLSDDVYWVQLTNYPYGDSFTQSQWQWLANSIVVSVFLVTFSISSLT